MYIDKKYLTIYTGEPISKYPPKIYVDFFIHRANLKVTWKDNNNLHFNVGFFSFYLSISVNWGFVVRERNEKEEEQYKITMEFINDFKE